MTNDRNWFSFLSRIFVVHRRYASFLFPSLFLCPVFLFSFTFSFPSLLYTLPLTFFLSYPFLTFLWDQNLICNPSIFPSAAFPFAIPLLIEFPHTFSDSLPLSPLRLYSYPTAPIRCPHSRRKKGERGKAKGEGGRKKGMKGRAEVGGSGRFEED